ncbi:hypothetical protein ACSDR0_47305 [Streptosporangium sp. G11]|uniref:hypothetical protein n=1 Tax=Streptosporangium sp. G11 TaxID=3436926 RepID=UPI003EB8AFD2
MKIGREAVATTAVDHWDLDRVVRLRRLVYLAEGDDVTIGRPDIDSYAVFPADGAELVRKLADGATPRQAADWYKTTYGESVDISDVLDALEELEFTGGPDQESMTEPVRWQRLGRALFSPVAWVGYSVLLFAWAAMIVQMPELRPEYRHMFFSDYYTVVALGLFFGQIPFLLVHESFHALAGRRLGIRSRLRISRRLYFLVFETTMDGLVVVERRKRYLPVLAGMLADVLAMIVLTFAASLFEASTLPGRICLALAFTALMRLAWQFSLYLQTDVYFLFSTLLGCTDLHGAAKGVLRNRWNRLLGRQDRLIPEESWSPVDRRVASWYSWLLVAGCGFSLAWLSITVAPALYHIVVGLQSRLSGSQGAQIADSVVFLLLTFGQISAALWLGRRKRSVS